MIIFGTRGLTSTSHQGTFHCPRCGPQRTYHWKRVNRWFTLYFIPVIPMGTAGEYLECTNCAGTFGTEATNYNPEAEQRELLDQIKRLLVLTSLAQGPPNETRVGHVRAAFAELTDVHLMDEELWKDFQLAQSARAQLIPYVQQVSESFNDQGKTMVLAGVFSLLSADGSFLPQDEELLRKVAGALGMPPSAAEAFIQRMKQVG